MENEVERGKPEIYWGGETVSEHDRDVANAPLSDTTQSTVSLVHFESEADSSVLIILKTFVTISGPCNGRRTVTLMGMSCMNLVS